MANHSVSLLADVNPKEYDTLKCHGALDAENIAWNAAQQWLQTHGINA